MTLAEFLLARIAEDEKAAYSNIESPPGYAPRAEDDPLVLWARRVLVACDAKRRIVELHAEDVHECVDMVAVHEPCTTVQLLALPYADHPDYDPAWAPDTVTTA